LARQRMNAADRKQSIIDATIKVVARTNYDRATTTLIAGEAGINEALIYHYFKSKQELQIVMLDTIRDNMLGILDNAKLFEKKSKGVMWSIARQYQKAIRFDVNILSCIMKAAVYDDRKISVKAWEIIKANLDFIAGLLESARENGHIGKGHNINAVSWLIMSFGVFLSFLTIIGRPDEIPEEGLAEAVKWIESILTSNLKIKK